MPDVIRPAAVAAVRPLVEHFEGLNLKAYRDEVNVWTIGYGHTADEGPPFPSEGMTITTEEADQILAEDLQRNAIGVASLVKAQINDAMFGALTSFAFNLGLGNLRQSSLLAYLNARNFFAAANEFGKWNHAGGKVFNGLTRRRSSEVNFFCGFPEPIVLSAAMAKRLRVTFPKPEPLVLPEGYIIRYPKKKVWR